MQDFMKNAPKSKAPEPEPVKPESSGYVDFGQWLSTQRRPLPEERKHKNQDFLEKLGSGIFCFSIWKADMWVENFENFLFMLNS